LLAQSHVVSLHLLLNDAVSAQDIRQTQDLPVLAGAMLKNEQDITLLQRLSAMTRNRAP